MYDWHASLSKTRLVKKTLVAFVLTHWQTKRVILKHVKEKLACINLALAVRKVCRTYEPVVALSSKSW